MFMFVGMVLLEGFKFIRLGQNNFSLPKVFNLFVIIHTGCCLALLTEFAYVNQDDTAKSLTWSLELGHLLVVSSTMNVLSKLGDFPTFGNVVYCGIEVLESLCALISVYILPLLIAFGFFYHIRKDGESSFHLEDLITRPLSMMIGTNISVKDFLTPASQVTTPSVQIVLIIFICLMCILSCRFLESLTVNKFDFYLKKGALNRLENTALNFKLFSSDHDMKLETLIVEKNSRQNFINKLKCLFVICQRHYELATPTIFYKAMLNNQTIMFVPSWIIDQAGDIMNDLERLEKKNSEKEKLNKEQENVNKQFDELKSQIKTSNLDKKVLVKKNGRQQRMILKLHNSQQNLIENQKKQLVNQEKLFSAQMKELAQMRNSFEKLSNADSVQIGPD